MAAPPQFRTWQIMVVVVALAPVLALLRLAPVPLVLLSLPLSWLEFLILRFGWRWSLKLGRETYDEEGSGWAFFVGATGCLVTLSSALVVLIIFLPVLFVLLRSLGIP